VRLYKKGLIYRGKRIINWCPRCTTALSDEEVDYKDENGMLYYIKYPLEDGSFITVATTRPETMLGDTAVAVHPEDSRYRGIIGKKVKLPFVNRIIPIIPDSQVEKEFGTGAVKVTPAHDPADFLIGKRNNLPAVTVMDQTGVMNDNAGKFAGMDRFLCRKRIVEELSACGLLAKVEPYTHRIGHCYRCDTVIEPYLSEQWFVNMKPLAGPAITAVTEGKLVFYPERWTRVYLHWMENIQDWCISRQIWWGHRIPVWYCRDSGCPPIVEMERPDRCPECGSENIVQDPDVLDTWFSSWLWPFGVFGWPKQTEDLKTFYPTDTLSTAQEILFFWVARMIMAGYEFMGDLPFRKVYIHATVRDETGRKMSKSYGNAVDPVEIIEETGADSLRFSLISLSSFGQDMFLPDEFHHKGRNFLNKIWNAFRYLAMKSGNRPGKLDISVVESNSANLRLAEKWILNLLNRCIERTTNALEEFHFNEATDNLYEFFWHEFCDWYLEISKIYREDDPYFTATVLPVSWYVMTTVMRLLHPFVPFITEEIWNRASSIVDLKDELIIKSPWPVPCTGIDSSGTDEIEEIKQLVVEMRDVKTTFKIPIIQQMQGVFYGINALKKDELRAIVEFLVKVKFAEVDSSVASRPAGMVVRNWDSGWYAVSISGFVDPAKERARIEANLAKVRKTLENTERKLGDANFLKNAPERVKENTVQLKEKLEKEIRKLEKNLALLSLDNAS
jgi:valyl-tRNA synthetase